MNNHKLVRLIGGLLVLIIIIEGIVIFKLRYQQREQEIGLPGAAGLSQSEADWFNKNEDHFFDLFTGMDNMQRDMDQLFRNFSMDSHIHPGFDSFFGDFSSTPVMDYREEDDRYVIEIELPGVENSSIEVKVEEGMLMITAETSRDQDQDASKFKRSERFSGKFSRSLSLPQDADAEKMTTSLEKGVLEIVLPKIG